MTKRKTTRRAKASASRNSLLTALATPAAPPNFTRTENNAASLATTTSAVLDWFSGGGAMRNEDDAKIQAVFAKAFAEDRLLATKVAFYIRDIRGGQGQRKSFRAVLRWLASNAPNVVRKNLALVPEFGRWDDVLSLLGTPVETSVYELIALQLKADIRAAKSDDTISLLAKWLPSANTSSKVTRNQACKVMQALSLTPRQYRKVLVNLRARANIVERAMCAKDWTGIDYEKVPSRASMLYRKAFSQHDPAGYAKWKGAAFRGEAKVHAATLYPYDIVHKAQRGSDETLELLWRNLPNLFTGKVHNGLAVVDVSGSMAGWNYGEYGAVGPKGTTVRPIDIALSLGLYFAERCEGAFKDHFITFSSEPELQKINAGTLFDRMQQLSRSSWNMNTDIQKVFGLILDRAVAAKVKPEEMPEAIYILSDMQFDQCALINQTNLDAIKARYAIAGYKAPLLVFWTIRNANDKVALKNERGVVMVSGFSPNALTSILKLEAPLEVTPYDLMLATVNTERYESITV